MTIQYSKQFLSDVARLKEGQKKQLKSRLLLFQDRPNYPTLRNHKLKGKLKGYCSINITGDIRAIYKIQEYPKKESMIKFVRLGTHSELYG